MSRKGAGETANYYVSNSSRAAWGRLLNPRRIGNPPGLSTEIEEVDYQSAADCQSAPRDQITGGTCRPLACALLALFLPLVASAVIVDRIAISVGDKIVTESEIDLRIRLSAFQNREKADFSLSSRRRAAQELIDQRLVEREMDLGRYPRVEETRRKALLAEYESDPDALAKALAFYGLKPQDLEEDLGRQSDLLTFLNLRFRPAVQVTDQDVQKYFAENVLKGPGKTLQEAQAGALNEMRAEIEQKLTTERADKELDLWLMDQRKRTKIEYLEKDLEGK